MNTITGMVQKWYRNGKLYHMESSFGTAHCTGCVYVHDMKKDLTALARVRALARTGVARQIRRDAAISQSELGSTVGVTAACISRWESGKRVPRGRDAFNYLSQLDLLRGSECDSFDAAQEREAVS